VQEKSGEEGSQVGSQVGEDYDEEEDDNDYAGNYFDNGEADDFDDLGEGGAGEDGGGKWSSFPIAGQNDDHASSRGRRLRLNLAVTVPLSVLRRSPLLHLDFLGVSTIS
jgi:hypothetical protein